MRIFGILNLTDDSFFEPGEYLDPVKATKKAQSLIASGAYALDIGAVASNPAAKAVPSKTELTRITTLLKLLQPTKVKISIDTYSTKTQKKLLTEKQPFAIDYLNDINGFNDPALYEALNNHSCALIVMHSVQEFGRADMQEVSPTSILPRITGFFETRINQLLKAGIKEQRIIIDPGMGFFLGTDPLSSLMVLKNIPKLKKMFQLPIMVSVSRKSFIRKLAGCSTAESLAPTIVAETFAFASGIDFIRTHDVKSLQLAVNFWKSLNVTFNN